MIFLLFFLLYLSGPGSGATGLNVASLIQYASNLPQEFPPPSQKKENRTAVVDRLKSETDEANATQLPPPSPGIPRNASEGNRRGGEKERASFGTTEFI